MYVIVWWKILSSCVLGLLANFNLVRSHIQLDNRPIRQFQNGRLIHDQSVWWLGARPPCTNSPITHWEITVFWCNSTFRPGWASHHLESGLLSILTRHTFLNVFVLQIQWWMMVSFKVSTMEKFQESSVIFLFANVKSHAVFRYY